MARYFCAVVLFSFTVLSWARPNREQENRAIDEVLRTLGAVRAVHQTAISPDGSRVAWVEAQSRDGRHGSVIQVAAANGSGSPRRISAGKDLASESQVTWSPDSKQIAFLSDADSNGRQQLYVADIQNGKARKLTDLTGFVSTPGWSPDGRTIAFLFIENSPRAAGPLQPMTPPSGVMEKTIYEQRVNLVDASGGKIRAVSPADMYVYEYDWAPDNKGFVTTAAHGDGDNNWWTAQLYWMGLDGQVRSLYKPALQIANPRVSPNGQNVAFIQGLMSDQGVVGGDVFLLPLSGGEARNLTSNMPASATWLAWSGPREILFTELVDGNSGVAVLDMGGSIETVWQGPEVISAGGGDVSLSLARDGRQSAVVRSSASSPPEVWTGKVGEWKQMTQANRQVKPVWGEQRSVHWSSDTFRIQGWLLLPQNYDPKKKYPLIVNVHGGPASACVANWPQFTVATMAAAGYAVLCPNPRGSFGQGATFARANVKDFGGGDFRDIMAGVDEVLRDFPIDSARLGIWGWSYGGYMTMWAETQTRRFAAAVAGAGVSNWLSYYGQNSIDQWMIPFFGASVYDDPEVYARSAPINYVKNVTTPTLILVGERDGECPAPQSFEWWHALKTLRVPVEFVVFPGEGHQIQSAQHRRELIQRSIRWFDKWLTPSKEAPPIPAPR